MVGPGSHRQAGFSLSLSHGTGQLILTDRPIGERFVVDTLALSLPRLPTRLDMSAGVEVFRHQRCTLERLAAHVDETALTQALGDVDGLADLEVRIGDDEITVAGAVVGEPAVPFITRFRLATASLAAERAVLVSAWQSRVFGPAVLSGPQVAGRLLAALGLADRQKGPTVASFDPVDACVLEVCAYLGWKAPARGEVRLEAVRCVAGRLQCVAARPSREDVGPQGVITTSEPGGVKTRWFLADYEAKALFATIEAHIAAGALDVAVGAYQRQLEIHPGHPFIVRRLLQLYAAMPAMNAEGRHLARTRLARHPDDIDAMITLATLQWRRGDGEAAAGHLSTVTRQLDEQGDALGAAQARCALALALQDTDPSAAISAFEAALAQRRRLPMALRALAELYERVGDRAAMLRTLERLVTAAPGPEARRRALLTLGRAAHDDTEIAQRAFNRLLRDQPDDIDALRGLAQVSDSMVAMRALDRAARVYQARGDAQGASDVITELGDLWLAQPDGVDAAVLRYRQAQMLAPGAVGALVGLAEVAIRQGDRATARERLLDIISLANQSPGRVTDPVAIHLRLGRLLAEDGEPAQAVVHLQRALAGQPEQVDAALELLAGVYSAADRYDDLARVQSFAAARAASPGERGRRLAELALLVADRLGDGERAARLLREASHLRPHDAAILSQLAELLRRQDKIEPLEAVLAQLAGLLGQADELAAVHVERAELLFRRLNRADEAAVAFGLALGCAPTHADALRGLSEIYRGQERVAELVTVLRRLAPLSVPHQALAFWLEAGRLAAGPLGRPDEAAHAFDAALAVDPDDTEALRRAGDLHFEAGRAEAAMPHYRRLFDLYEEDGYDEAAAPFLQRLAAAHAQMGQHPAALSVLTEAARIDPNDITTYERAQDLLLRAGDVRGIVTFFSAGLQRADTPRTRALLARRAGRLLWRELRQPEEAAPMLDEAVAADPGDADVLRIRQEVATALGDDAGLRRLLRMQADAAPAARRPALRLRLAELLANAGLAHEAEAELDAVLADRPGYAPAEALRVQWARAVVEAPGRADAPSAKQATADPAPDAEAPTSIVPSAAPASSPPASSPPASSPFASSPPASSRPASSPPASSRPASSRPASSRPASSRPASSLLEVSTPPALVRPSIEPVAARPAEPVASPVAARPAQRVTEPGSRVVLVADDDPEVALARLLAEATDRDTAAAWLAVAEHRRDALRRPDSAVPDFERAIARGTPEEAAWHEAMEALEDLHSLRGEQAALRQLYDLREAAGDGEPVHLALLRAAAWRAEGAVDAAIDAAKAGLPDERAVMLIVELLSEAGRPGEAADRLLEDITDLSATARMNRRWLAAERLAQSDAARALAIYAEAWPEAQEPLLLEDWLQLARTADEPSALQAAHIAQARLADDGPPRSRAMSDAARAAERRPDGSDDACSLWQQAVTAWPSNMDALEALGEALVRADRLDAAADNLDAQIGSALPGPWRAGLAIRLADLACTLDDLPRAQAALSLAGADAPEAPGLVAVRARLTIKAAAIVEGAKSAELPAEPFKGSLPVVAVPVVEPEASIDASIGAPADPVLADSGSRDDEPYRTAQVPIAPPPPRARPAATPNSGPPADLVDPALLRLSQAGDWPAVIAGLGDRAAQTDDGAQRTRLLLRRAELAERRLAAVPDALRDLRAVLESADAPTETVIQAMQTIARLDPDASHMLTQELDRRLPLASDREARAALLAVRGELAWRYQSDADGARADFHAAAAEAPGAALAAAGLGTIAADSGAHRTALAWLQVALHAGPQGPAALSPAQESAAFTQLTRVLIALDRRADLAPLAGAILDANPGCRPALAVVDMALSAESRWLALLTRIDAAIDALSAPASDIIWRKSEILAGPLRRRPEAVASVDAVLAIEPDHRAARRLALALAGEREAWSDYVQHGEALLEGADESGERIGPEILRLAVARVHADLLGQPARALGHLRSLDADDALGLDASEFYVQTARATGDVSALGDALGARALLQELPGAWLSLVEHLLGIGDLDAAAEARAHIVVDGVFDPSLQARLAKVDDTLG
ncbi:MAG: tetratricopeptide (TPR) repeat protein [Bradymonadia bacterium]|jgi:tetratricopeptide (TPR) repeat protein